MAGYLVRRVLLIVPTIFIVTVLVFSLARFIPGSVIDRLVSEMAGYGLAQGGEQVDIESIKHQLGLDVPVHVQYVRWAGAILTRGDFGDSLWTRRPLVDELRVRYPVTFELSLMALIISVIVAVPVGIYSAIRQDTAGDYLGRSIAIAGLSIPNFWVGTIIMVIPAIIWGWSPPVEYIQLARDPLGNLGQFIIPATIMGMSTSAGLMRMTRTMMLEVLRNDYVRTAWSKGLTEKMVVMRHAFKNAALPLITMLGARIPGLLAGSVIMEQIFALPGMGRLMIDAINTRDYPVISGINLIMAILTLVCILLTDVSYAYVDPRIRYR
ncbi:MAG: ABC transporter permease [Dehalococcoidia bacterium]|nr:ABC transporter permease [Dehalococcoidia bacterium]